MPTPKYKDRPDSTAADEFKSELNNMVNTMLERKRRQNDFALGLRKETQSFERGLWAEDRARKEREEAAARAEALYQQRRQEGKADFEERLENQRDYAEEVRDEARDFGDKSFQRKRLNSAIESYLGVGATEEDIEGIVFRITGQKDTSLSNLKKGKEDKVDEVIGALSSATFTKRKDNAKNTDLETAIKGYEDGLSVFGVPRKTVGEKEGFEQKTGESREQYKDRLLTLQGPSETAYKLKLEDDKATRALQRKAENLRIPEEEYKDKDADGNLTVLKPDGEIFAAIKKYNTDAKFNDFVETGDFNVWQDLRKKLLIMEKAGQDIEGGTALLEASRGDLGNGAKLAELQDNVLRQWVGWDKAKKDYEVEILDQKIDKRLTDNGQAEFTLQYALTHKRDKMFKDGVLTLEQKAHLDKSAAVNDAALQIAIGQLVSSEPNSSWMQDGSAKLARDWMTLEVKRMTDTVTDEELANHATFRNDSQLHRLLKEQQTREEAHEAVLNTPWKGGGASATLRFWAGAAGASLPATPGGASLPATPGARIALPEDEASQMQTPPRTTGYGGYDSSEAEEAAAKSKRVSVEVSRLKSENLALHSQAQMERKQNRIAAARETTEKIVANQNKIKELEATGELGETEAPLTPPLSLPAPLTPPPSRPAPLAPAATQGAQGVPMPSPTPQPLPAEPAQPTPFSPPAPISAEDAGREAKRAQDIKSISRYLVDKVGEQGLSPDEAEVEAGLILQATEVGEYANLNDIEKNAFKKAMELLGEARRRFPEAAPPQLPPVIGPQPPLSLPDPTAPVLPVPALPVPAPMPGKLRLPLPEFQPQPAPQQGIPAPMAPQSIAPIPVIPTEIPMPANPGLQYVIPPAIPPSPRGPTPQLPPPPIPQPAPAMPQLPPTHQQVAELEQAKAQTAADAANLERLGGTLRSIPAISARMPLAAQGVPMPAGPDPRDLSIGPTVLPSPDGAIGSLPIPAQVPYAYGLNRGGIDERWWAESLGEPDVPLGEIPPPSLISPEAPAEGGIPDTYLLAALFMKKSAEKGEEITADAAYAEVLKINEEVAGWSDKEKRGNVEYIFNMKLMARVARDMDKDEVRRLLSTLTPQGDPRGPTPKLPPPPIPQPAPQLPGMSLPKLPGLPGAAPAPAPPPELPPFPK